VPAHIAPWLAEALRQEREKKGWSQADLARHSIVDPSHLSDLEAGRRTPQVATMEKLTAALGIRISALFGEAERLMDEAQAIERERSQ